MIVIMSYPWCDLISENIKREVIRNLNHLFSSPVVNGVNNCGKTNLHLKRFYHTGAERPDFTNKYCMNGHSKLF